MDQDTIQSDKQDTTSSKDDTPLVEAENNSPSIDAAENLLKEPSAENHDNDKDKDTDKDGSLNKDIQTKSNKKRASKKDDRQQGVKRTRWDNRRIPNIAAELAKNRNIARGPSPSPATAASSPTVPQTSNAPQSVKSDSESQSPEPTDPSSKKDSNPKRTQVKISSLLSSNGEESNTAALPAVKSENELLPMDHTGASLQAPVASRASPKVILPTQIPGSAPPESNDSTTDTPGVLIARMSSPVSIPPQAQFKKTMSSLAGENKPQTELAQKSNSMSSLPQSKEKQTNSSNNKPAEPKKNNSPKSSSNKESSKAGGTKNDGSTSTKKESSGSAKKDGASGGGRKDNSSGKDNNPSNSKKDNPSGSVKRENSATNNSKSNEKKDNKPTGKSSIKKENGSTTGTSTANKKPIDTKKKPPVKKETAPASKPAKTPKKLVAAPSIKSPSLLEVLERGKTQEEPEEPALIVDVPLYSTDTNEYLDENGQVVFNFYKVVQDKFSSDNGGGNPTDLKAAKRNLFGQISGTQMDGAAEEDDDDIEEVEEEGEEEEEEEGEEPKQNVSPKKKSHPNKGKSLIGKYDTEDPFIDDTELLWEEQRAATKDGFFVYFGPLIEKGHYASLERADGTMKRGGVKNK